MYRPRALYSSLKRVYFRPLLHCDSRPHGKKLPGAFENPDAPLTGRWSLCITYPQHSLRGLEELKAVSWRPLYVGAHIQWMVKVKFVFFVLAAAFCCMNKLCLNAFAFQGTSKTQFHPPPSEQRLVCFKSSRMNV